MREATWILVVGLVFVSPGGAEETSLDLRSLNYVESSTGLIPPTLDGGPTEIEMGDVDGDGNIDLVSVGDHGSPLVGTDQHGVMVWFGDGAGGWAVQMAGHFGYGGMALGDVNSDGFIDVGYGIHHNYSATDFGDQLLEVALGDGSGRNWIPWDDGLAENGQSWGLSATDFADVDGNGDLDLGSVGFGCCDGVHVYLNRADGSWEQSFGVAEGNSRPFFVFGDVSGDGAADFAVSHEDATVYLGDGRGGFISADGNLPPGDSRGRAGVALGDVTGDGNDELSFCNTSGGIEVWAWAGDGHWTRLTGDLPATGRCEATQLFDMDMDGYVDVVSFGSGEGEVWGGDGRGGWNLLATFNTPPIGTTQAFRVGGDTDHNGFPDLLLVADEGVWPSLRNQMHVFNEASTASGLEIKPVWPRGGETIRAGGTVFIDWISAVPGSGAGRAALELSVGGAMGPWQPIASELPDNGRYQWVVPSTTPQTREALIRFTLTVGDDTVRTVLHSPFTITNGSTVERSRTRYTDPDSRRVPSLP